MLGFSRCTVNGEINRYVARSFKRAVSKPKNTGVRSTISNSFIEERERVHDPKRRPGPSKSSQA